MTSVDPAAASPEVTGGAGFTFEDSVAAVYAAALLGETTAPGLPNRQVTQLSVQRGALGHPLDDVIVEARGADASSMRLSLQVKRKLVISSANSNSDFRETVLRAYATVCGTAFKVNIDRVGAVTGEIADGSKRDFETLCEWARSESTAAGFVGKVQAEGVAGEKKNQLDAVRAILSGRVEKQNLDEATWWLLSHFVLIRFEMLHEGSTTESDVVARLANCLPQADRPRADDLWRRILALVRVAEGHAASFDRKTLVTRLNSAVRLAGAASMHSALTILSQEARAACAEIGNSIDGITIPRERFVRDVTNALSESRFVQIGGLPGTGKSAVLRTILDAALSQGPVLFLKADRLSGAAWSQYATSIGCGGVGLEDLLVELAAVGSPTVYVDGLDRVEVRHRGIVLDVVNTLLTSPLLVSLRLLVTVRDTGLEPLRTWLPAQLFAAGAKTIEVSELDDQEAQALAVQRPSLEPLLFGSDQVREIVRRPFFAAVLARQYANKTDVPQSEVELATAWWNCGGYGAEAAQAHQRRKTLVDLARAGAAALGRRIPSLNLDSQSLADLVADGIVRDARAGQSVRFVHDIYFEWAFLQLLVSQSAQWLDVIRQVGEPPVLGRVVELLSQAELKDGQDWRVRLEQLEAISGVRSQWLRAWLLGPFGLPDFESRNTVYNEVMLAAGAKRVSKLVVWYQAEKTKPNPFALDKDRFPDIEFALRLRYADLLALPSDISQWRSLCDWLVKHIDQIPVTTRPEILSVFEVWQNAAADVKNRVSTSILQVVKSWLLDIEIRFHARGFPRDHGEWNGLDRGVAEELESRLRAVLLRAGRAYPQLVKEYLATLQTVERPPGQSVKEVISYSPILSKACAKELVDFCLHHMLRRLPEQVKRLATGPLGYDPHDHDWQSLSIDDQHSFFPCAPTRQPFPSLFDCAPDEARRLVRELANHAITSWRQLNELDWDRRAKPIPLVLTFPWGEQTFWGAEQEYVWSRGTWGSHVVGSGLMALEDWAFREIEKGRSIDDILKLVLEDHNSVAALGVACAITVETQQCSDVTLPLLTSQRLWKWDLRRCVQEKGGNHVSLLGFMLHDREHVEAVRRLNTKSCRKGELRWLAAISAISEGDLAAKTSAAITAFVSNLPFDYEEERLDQGTVESLQRTAEIWSEFGKRGNYRATPSSDGKGIIVEVENPKAQGPDIERIKQRQQAMAEHFSLLNWAHDSFEKGAISERLTIEDAIHEGRRLDAPELFDEAHAHVEPAYERQAAVAGVAAIVIRLGKSAPAIDVDWAADVCLRAWLTPEAQSDLFYRGSVLMHHPVLYACRGLAGLLRVDAFQRQALEALIQLAAHPYDQVVVEAFIGLLSAWGHNPTIGWLGLQLANSLAVVERYPSDFGSEDYAKREQARVAKVVESGLEQCEVLGDRITPISDLPPAWIENPGAKRVARGRRGDQVVVGWQYPALDLHADFLKKILSNIPVEEAMRDGLRRELFLSWCSALVTWTVERLCPAWSRSGVNTEEFEAASTELFEWRRELYRFLGTVALHLDVSECVKRFIEPAASTNDKTFISLLQSFVWRLTCDVMDAPALPTESLAKLQQIVPRLLAYESWGRLSGRNLALDDSELADIIQMMFFVRTDGQMGAARFANRDWKDVDAIFPLIQPILEGHGRTSRVASALLTLCERAIENYPVESFVQDIAKVLPSTGPLQSGWRDASIAARLSGLIQQFSEKAQPLPASMARDMLKALDILVDLGDRRAAAVQTSEVFKDVRLNSSLGS